MDRARRLRDFAVAALLRAAVGGAIVFVLLFVIAPALVSAHSTPLLWLGVVAVMLAVLAAIQTLYGLWRTWRVHRHASLPRA